MMVVGATNVGSIKVEMDPGLETNRKLDSKVHEKLWPGYSNINYDITTILQQ